eukprot:6195960-Pleurochrysis_carterae.AAC.1
MSQTSNYANKDCSCFVQTVGYARASSGLKRVRLAACGACAGSEVSVLARSTRILGAAEPSAAAALQVRGGGKARGR